MNTKLYRKKNRPKERALIKAFFPRWRESASRNKSIWEGTIPQRSCPGTSQQNGRAERKHRHILDTTRALLLSTNVPEPFRGEAAHTAVYTINGVPSSVIHNQSPYERLYGTRLPYSQSFSDVLATGFCPFIK